MASVVMQANVPDMIASAWRGLLSRRAGTRPP